MSEIFSEQQLHGISDAVLSEALKSGHVSIDAIRAAAAVVGLSPTQEVLRWVLQAASGADAQAGILAARTRVVAEKAVLLPPRGRLVEVAGQRAFGADEASETTFAAPGPDDSLGDRVARAPPVPVYPPPLAPAGDHHHHQSSSANVGGSSSAIAPPPLVVPIESFSIERMVENLGRLVLEEARASEMRRLFEVMAVGARRREAADAIAARQIRHSNSGGSGGGGGSSGGANARARGKSARHLGATTGGGMAPNGPDEEMLLFQQVEDAVVLNDDDLTAIIAGEDVSALAASSSTVAVTNVGSAAHSGGAAGKSDKKGAKDAKDGKLEKKRKGGAQKDGGNNGGAGIYDGLTSPDAGMPIPCLHCTLDYCIPRSQLSFVFGRIFSTLAPRARDLAVQVLIMRLGPSSSTECASFDAYTKALGLGPPTPEEEHRVFLLRD